MQTRLIKFVFWAYHYFFSPILHLIAGPSFGCRFVPSCGHYSSEALQTHGWMRGSLLILRRISRCQPFAQAGFDPVPHAIAGSSLKINVNQGR